MTLKWSISVLCAFFALSCSQPVRHSGFCNVDGLCGWLAEDTLTVSVDLTGSNEDSLLFLTAQTSRNIVNSQTGQFTVFLDFISPSGSVYHDTATLDIGAGKVFRSTGTLQIAWPYIQIGKLNRDGTWNIRINRSNQENPLYGYILGMGVSTENNLK